MNGRADRDEHMRVDVERFGRLDEVGVEETTSFEGWGERRRPTSVVWRAGRPSEAAWATIQ